MVYEVPYCCVIDRLSIVFWSKRRAYYFGFEKLGHIKIKNIFQEKRPKSGTLRFFFKKKLDSPVQKDEDG
jgi:hypothetical protein